MPIYFRWFTKALLSVGGDASDQNLPQSGRLLYCVISGFINISNEVGRVKSVSLFFYFFRTHLQLCSPVAFSDGRCAAILGLFFLSNLRARFVSLHRLGVVHQTSLRSRATMMMYSNSLTVPGRQVAYSLIRSRFSRTTVAIRHPRMDTTVFLPRLSATAELLVINLVTQHDPESDSQFPGCCDSRFPQSLLHQFAPIEAFQLRIPPDCVHRRFTPQITQQCVPLFAHRTQPLPASAGVFARDHADVTGQRFPIAEPHWIAQEHFGG